MKKIHTNIVGEAKKALGVSKLTKKIPPDICGEEEELPRKYRVDLARLRSGWHPKLENYLHRVGKLRTPQCRRCQRGTGDVKHFLLQCPRLSTVRRDNPITNLDDPWMTPLAAAKFIREAGLGRTIHDPGPLQGLYQSITAFTINILNIRSRGTSFL